MTRPGRGSTDTWEVSAMQSDDTALCQCGCGRPVTIASCTSRRRGWIKGQPIRYYAGHHRIRPAEERFWEKVNKNGPIQSHVPELGPCWIWIAGITPITGYGAFHVSSELCVSAHRYSYSINCGEISDGLFVLHRCDNRPCVRPDHLFLGTNADNHRDKAEKGRAPSGANTWHARMPEKIVRGEQHGAAKLTDASVLDIRQRLARGEMHKDIAFVHGVSKTTISLIRNGKRWMHV